MKKRRIYDDELYAHFITFSCYRRRNLLNHDRAKKIVLGVLNSELEKFQAKCIGFVIMPNHVHAVVWFPEPNWLSQFMKQWKQRSAFAIKRFLQDELEQYADFVEEHDAVWQRKYYAFQIYSRGKLEEKLTYMHMNPVRAGLVEKAVDWRWSSARWYEAGRTVGVPIEWVE